MTLAGLLTVYATAATAISFFISSSAPAYYALYIVVAVSGAMINSIYYILFSDYFTVLDGKRYSGAMTIALGVGAMLGSLLVGLLTQFAEPRRLFLVLPVIVGATLAHLIWLSRREQPLDEIESNAEEGMLESLKVLPKMAKRYPIVTLMALAVFINIIGQCVIEFEAFSIYTKSFPDEGKLAGFLSTMNAVVEVIGVLFVFFVSEPLIPKLGVARMLLIPPAINLVSFLVVSTTSSLPAGVLAHLNYSPLEYSLNIPIFALAYNAVPYRFVGRVRVINDGVLYPLGMAAAGVLLLLMEHVLSLRQIGMLGVVATSLYLTAQSGVGRQYLKSLVAMLRSGSIALDQVGDGFVLPAEYAHDIEHMVRSDDPDTVILGFEMASKANLTLTLEDFEHAVQHVPADTIRSAFAEIAKRDAARGQAQMQPLLGSASPLVRSLALEGLITSGLESVPDAMRRWLEDSDEAVRSVAAAGLVTKGEALADDILANIRHEEAASAALNVLGGAKGDNAIPILRRLGDHESPRVRAKALNLAAAAVQVGDARCTEWGQLAFADPDPEVRAAGAQLLAVADTDETLAKLAAEAFAAEDAGIRRACSLAMGRRGGAALPLLAKHLREAEADVADEVMDGIGVADPKTADGILFAFLSEKVYPAVSANLEAANRLPLGDPAWRPLALALADSNHRGLHHVLHALGVLGHKRVLGVVRRTLKANDARTRANAIETLSSLAHRQYVLPLLPLLESADGEASEALSVDSGGAEKELAELTRSPDAFIRAAALTIQATLYPDLPISPPEGPTPAIVEATCRRIAAGSIPPTRYDEEFPMNRLAFLKSVPLFSEMSLDHLLAVDAAMVRETYLPEEAIVREGDLGDKLYIVFKGEVAIRKRMADSTEKEITRLSAGQLFGEMSIFDDERRSASVVATTDAELLALDRDHFHSLAYQRPEIPMEVCKVLVGRLRTANG